MPHKHSTDRYEEALDLLAASSLRVTAPRRALLALLTREHGPFTMEEIHARIGPETCDLVTVYRSISAMEGIGLIRRCDFGDNSYRYEFNAGDHHHHHLICRKCHRVETLDFCVVDGLERVARQRGFESISHTLELFGVCPECIKRAK